MATCFVIQKFDKGGTFDQLYDQVFEPAIRAAEFDPDRVDRDPSVAVPIARIEEGIRQAGVCFAEISTDSPNVWFELGYALSAGKPVVMVCSDERGGRYPFDIQHRHIVTYKTAVPSDFDVLKEEIRTRLRAAMDKRLQSEMIQDLSAVKETEGLTPHEMAAVAAMVEGMFEANSPVSCYQIRDSMERAGYTRVAYLLATAALLRKNLIFRQELLDDRNDPYEGYCMTTEGLDWLERHKDGFVLKKPNTSTVPKDEDAIPDVPF